MKNLIDIFETYILKVFNLKIHIIFSIKDKKYKLFTIIDKLKYIYLNLWLEII